MAIGTTVIIACIANKQLLLWIQLQSNFSCIGGTRTTGVTRAGTTSTSITTTSITITRTTEFTFFNTNNNTISITSSRTGSTASSTSMWATKTTVSSTRKRNKKEITGPQEASNYNIKLNEKWLNAIFTVCKIYFFFV